MDDKPLEAVMFVGGPRHGDTLHWQPQNYLLLPQSGGGTHWYRHSRELNSMTGERRELLVYMGLSHTNEPPEVT